jgi:hypothetical protein
MWQPKVRSRFFQHLEHGPFDSREIDRKPQHMKRILAVAMAMSLASCGGGGGGKSSQIDSPTPTGPTNSGTPTATGDPSNLDYITLGAQLVSMAADQIVQSLSGSGVSAASRVGPLELKRPAQNINRTAGFYCCGASTATFVTMTTAVTVPNNAGALGILQTIGSLTEPEWSSTVANGWRVDLSQLRITSELDTSGSSVNPTQQLRLSGTLRYTMPNASTKEQTVDVVFRYANLESSVPTATGKIGPATLSGEPTAPLIQPGRCSRPREGCGPTVSGDAPCTVWPKCPGT